MDNENKLKSARLSWQLGDWESLAAIELSGPSRERMTKANLELALYKSQALFQIGEADEAAALLRDLKAAGAPADQLLKSLWSGAQASLARGLMYAGNKVAADAANGWAVGAHANGTDLGAVAEIRSQNEWKRVRRLSHQEHDRTAVQRKLFIDCGGFDGCSSLKFLLSFPEFDAVTFEPNPALWRYYETLPTELIKKAVHTYDGEVTFRIDAVDGDGSSLVESKVVDYHRTMSNEESPLLAVPCVDLSAFVARKAVEYGKIVLKLDVEGAEYDILEKMLQDGTLSFVDQLYCEFHHDKIDIPIERHRDILERARAVTRVEPWDANYSVFMLAPKDKPEQIEIRTRIVNDIHKIRQKLLRLQW